MKSKLKTALLSAAAVACMGTAVNAGSFATVWIMGSTTDNGSDWSSSLTVTAGEKVYYEVMGELAATAVYNSTHPYTLVQPQIAVTDGINSLSLNLTETAASATLAVPILNSAWNQHTGQSAGNASGNKISGIEVGAGISNYLGGTSATQLLTGSFTAGSAASDTLIASWNTSASGSIKVDTTAGQKTVGVTSSTEAPNGADPYVGYAPLTLTESGPVAPEPSILGGVALAAGLGVIQFARRCRVL